MSDETKKDRLERLAADDQYISGVHNYCDRWCERCTLRSRCLSFAMDPDICSIDIPDEEFENEMFVQKVHENFEMVFQLLQASAEKWGIDLDAVIDDPEAEENECCREKTVEADPLIGDTRIYADAVDGWMVSRKRLFSEKVGQLEREAGMSLPGQDPIPEALALHDAVETIRWYQYFFYPKISRVMMGLLGDNDEDMMDDVLGSAKIALIAIDRSMSAWSVLGETLGIADDVIEQNIILMRIRKELEKRAPGAMKFKRPGFDE